MELALDCIGRKFGEQGRMPDCIESSRYVKIDSPDVISEIGSLHPLLGEQRQHVQGRLTESQSKLVI